MLNIRGTMLIQELVSLEYFIFYLDNLIENTGENVWNAPIFPPNRSKYLLIAPLDQLSSTHHSCIVVPHHSTPAHSTMDTGEEKDKGEVEKKAEKKEEEAISTSSAVSQLSKIMTKIVDLPSEEIVEDQLPRVVKEEADIKETTDIDSKGVYFLRDKLMEKEDSSADVENSPKESCVDVKEPVAKDTSSAVSQLSQIMTTEENSDPQIVEENKEAADINNKGVFY